MAFALFLNLRIPGILIGYTFVGMSYYRSTLACYVLMTELFPLSRMCLVGEVLRYLDRLLTKTAVIAQ